MQRFVCICIGFRIGSCSVPRLPTLTQACPMCRHLVAQVTTPSVQCQASESTARHTGYFGMPEYRFVGPGTTRGAQEVAVCVLAACSAQMRAPSLIIVAQSLDPVNQSVCLHCDAYLDTVEQGIKAARSAAEDSSTYIYIYLYC